MHNFFLKKKQKNILFLFSKRITRKKDLASSNIKAYESYIILPDIIYHTNTKIKRMVLIQQCANIVFFLRIIVFRL